MMEKCALIISANESYQKGEKKLETFTGTPVSYSTLHRLVTHIPQMWLEFFYQL